MDVKKIILPVLLVGVVGAYIIYQKFFTTPAPAPVNNDGQNNQTSAGSETTNPNPPTTTGGTTGYNNGEYTGDFADAFYGPVQVKAVITGGRITDIQFLQFPDHQGHTMELSNQVRPVLMQEAIQKQSANVDIISGATQTSQAFIKSLASALTKAGSQSQPNIEVIPPTPSGKQ